MTEEQIKNLHYKRGTIKGHITRFTKFLQTVTDDSTLEELNSRLEKFEPLWEELNDTQTELESIDTKTSIANHLSEREELENLYFKTVGQAKRLIKQLTTPLDINMPSNSHNFHNNSNGTMIQNINSNLPKLNLPEFHGAYDKWLQFSDTYKTMIHNCQSINKIQKFWYLKSCIKGEAANVLNALEVSEANYDKAWKLLCERFENKRVIIQTHLNAITDLPNVQKESHIMLRDIIDSVNQHLRSLESLGLPVDNWDIIIIHLISAKLDVSTKRQWQEHAMNLKSELPTFREFTAFLNQRCQLLEGLHSDKKIYNSTPKHFSKKSFQDSSIAHVATTDPVCIFCKKDHFLFTCANFLKLSVPQRISEVRKLNACNNCLRKGHSSRDCKNPHSCKKCSLRHNTLLHLNKEQIVSETISTNSRKNESDNSQSVTNISQSTITACSSGKSQPDSYVMLSTAIVLIFDKYGNTHKCRAILDNCSQSNFITERLFKTLELPTSKVTHSVEGFGSNITSVLQKTSATFKSKTNSCVFKDVPFLISHKITKDLPAISFNVSNIKIPPNIVLADEKFNEKGPIDMLIGASLFWDLISVGRINVIDNHTVLQKTKLGWIFSGPLPISHAESSNSICNLALQNENMHDLIERFWKLEECPSQVRYSPEEIECEKHFIDTTTRDEHGRFIVSLPFKDNMNQLGESFDVALKRFYAVEKKLAKNPQLKNDYVAFINEYEELGHMTKVKTSNDSSQNSTYYLPHHGVIKISSTTTKLRVVFDGSAKTSSGISLNDVLKVGPTIQDDLFTIVARFRTYQYVVTADIEKMYRMVKIQDDQRDFQRILWRSDPSEELNHYRLNTVTYGTASASFLAIRSLFQVAKENESKFPRASQIIKSDFYVDDLLTGFNSVEDGKQVLAELTHILSSAGFNLRKFMSNNCEILENITEIKSPSSQTFITDDKTTKTLGLIWNSLDDIFRFTVSYKQASNVTKRTILSAVAQIFDPLGLVGPCTIKAKIIIQKLWELGLHWDESLPVSLHSSWLEFSSQILHLNSLNVPRHIICPNPKFIELHCFGDASEKAYGACCYLRSIDQSDKIHVFLVCAKSRVAPLKMVTLPKLELCAALLSVQLSQKVHQAMSNKIDCTYYWSDSSIALAWINTEPHQLKTFVANRVTQIQQFSNKNQWSHIPSESNPADIISRGLNPKELMECKIWWDGPGWIHQKKSFWPRPNILPLSEIPEIKKTHITLITTAETPDMSILDRFSSLTRLHRVIAYCQRFANNAKISTREARFSGQLTRSELDNSLHTICKIIQKNAFSSELISLRKSKQISPSSKIVSLNPFLDKNGVIRVGGRLKYSNLSYDQKHPILLPHHCSYTKLVIEHEHLRHLHAGAQATLAAVRSNFWPINGRSAVRGVLRKCVTCFRSKPIESRYQMGDIPHSRLKPQRPFATTGIDFAGPFYIKDGKIKNRKLVKCYLCIFICFVTKAVHLELSDDLSTESFLKCLTRFVSRRGVCTDIHSDNGTNFVGTERELRIIVSNLQNSHNFNEFLNSNKINWHFSPPHAPNFGGLWEACVKSAKFHLKRIVGNSHLTFEGLYTVVTQVEAVLNSRPLYPLSNDPNDLSPLTPAHFLIGEPLTTLPQDDVRHIASNRLSQFQMHSTTDTAFLAKMVA